MIIPVKRFINTFTGFEQRFLFALDEAFRLVGTRTEPMQTSEDYAFSVNDLIDSLQVDATNGAVVVTLPPPSGNRRRRVIKTDASGNTVTVVGTINGAANYVLSTQYSYVWLEPTGSGWLIIGS